VQNIAGRRCHVRTTAEIANVAGVVVMGAAFFSIEASHSIRRALLAPSALFAVVSRLRRIPGADAPNHGMTN
jgi:hypothetical protein